MSNTKISIICYNTHLFGGMASWVSEGYADTVRSKKIVEYVKNSGADVVGLCEVWADSWKEEIANNSKPKYPYSFFKPGPWQTQGDGLVLLSKYPLANCQLISFNDAAGYLEKNFADKGVLIASVLRGNGMDFRVFMTHTQAQSDPDACVARQNNIIQLKGMVEACGDIPAILMGDLNIEPDEYDNHLVKVLSNMTDSYLVLHRPHEYGYTCDPSKNTMAQVFCNDQGGSRRYDYMFVSKGHWQVEGIDVVTDWTVDIRNDASLMAELTVARRSKGAKPIDTTGIEDCSDHYPLKATFTIKAQTDLSAENKAREKVDKYKTDYGTGVSNKIIFHNNTKEELKLVLSGDWNGSYSQRPPDSILSGDYAPFFHHKPSVITNGSCGYFIYRIGSTGYDIFCSFLSPWRSRAEKEGLTKVYVEIRETGHWENGTELRYKDDLEKLLLNSKYTSFDKSKYAISAWTENDTTTCTFFALSKQLT